MWQEKYPTHREAELWNTMPNEGIPQHAIMRDIMGRPHVFICKPPRPAPAQDKDDTAQLKIESDSWVRRIVIHIPDGVPLRTLHTTSHADLEIAHEVHVQNARGQEQGPHLRDTDVETATVRETSAARLRKLQSHHMNDQIGETSTCKSRTRR